MRFRTNRISDDFRIFGSRCWLFVFDASLPSITTFLVVSATGIVDIVVNGYPSHIQYHSQRVMEDGHTTQLT